MAGQGGPICIARRGKDATEIPANRSFACFRSALALSCRFLSMVLFIVSCCAISPGAETTESNASVNMQENVASSSPGTIRLNLFWSSEEPLAWSGHFQLTDGRFSDTVLLGNDSAGPGMFSLIGEKNGVITFATPKPVLFSGIQTTFHATSSSILNISMEIPGRTGKIARSIPIQDLLVQPCWIPFDNNDNGFYIERVKGDELPVFLQTVRRGENSPAVSASDSAMGETSLVFSPGDLVRLTVFPRLYQPLPEGELQLTARLVPAGKDQIIWTESREVTPPVTGKSFSFQFEIPNLEGAFDLTLVLGGKKSGFALLPNVWDTRKEQIVAERTLQGVVISGQPLPLSAKNSNGPVDLRNGLLETIDPTNPSWWKVFAKNRGLLGLNILPAVLPDNNSQPGDSSPQNSDMTILGQKPSASFGIDFLRKWTWSDFQVRLTPRRAGGRWGQWEELWQQSLGSGHLRPFDEKNPQYSSFAQLLPDPTGVQIPWEAYTIPVKEPGKPHLLEIDYLSHVPQKLAVSIIEPNVSGGIFPDSIDSGLVVPVNPLSDQTTDRILNHQILFWPRTKSPMILVMNRDKNRPAVFGRIRLYRAKDDLAVSTPSSHGRVFAAMMTRPEFIEQFSAPRVPCSVGVFGAENWNTVYTGIERLSDYLRVRKYDTLLLSVYADGSTLYPSSQVRPTPKYDSGIFLTRGEDPVRKDILELVARKFQRDSLSLVPLLTFNAPLPALEEHWQSVVASQNETAIRSLEGIRPLGPEGRLYIDSRRTSQGTGPYYNLLHPTVQDAMLAVITELTARYGRHRSLTGLAMELSTGGYAQLPDDIYYGMDDVTIGRFVQESDIVAELEKNPQIPLQAFLSAAGPERYRYRAQFIKDYCQVQWIVWRSQAVGRFYQRVRDTLRQYRPDFRLYLVGTKMFDGTQSQRLLSPGPSSETALREALLTIGFDPLHYAGDTGIALLRPGQLASISPLNEQQESCLLDSAESMALFGIDSVTTGVSFYHLPNTRNLPDFDRRSPFQPTVTQIATRALPFAAENRRRFAHQLAAADTFFFFDGGERIPFGQEESLDDWISVFQKLPPVAFHTVVPPVPEKKEKTAFAEQETASLTTDPVVMRSRVVNGEYWGYFVNDAPFHTNVRLAMKVQPGTKFTVYSGGYAANEPRSLGDSVEWSVALRPFDLIAMKLTDPKASVLQLEVSRPEEICGTDGTLAKEVNRYIDRLLLARDGLTMEITNGNFESPLPGEKPDPYKIPEPVKEEKRGRLNLIKNPFGHGDSKESKETTASEKPVSTAASSSPQNRMILSAEGESVPGWRQFGDSSFMVMIDQNIRREGLRSLCLESTGEPGGLISRPLDYKGTGRLCLQASFGVRADAVSLPLRLCLTGRYQGAAWQRQVQVGDALLARARQNQPEPTAVSVDRNVRWIDDIVIFDHLPSSGLEELSLRIDILGAGTVWIDNLRLYKMAFSEQEQRELTVLAEKLESTLAGERITGTMGLLDSYWSRLLSEEIPDSMTAAFKRPAKQPTKEELAAREPDPPKKKKGFLGLFK